MWHMKNGINVLGSTLDRSTLIFFWLFLCHLLNIHHSLLFTRIKIFYHIYSISVIKIILLLKIITINKKYNISIMLFIDEVG